jgi:ABC-type microcin C transport system duplicated ATPase subunit YejF
MGSALPIPVSSFIGREREIAALAAQVAASRLVSLVGPGGSGKTRLALEVVRRLPGTAEGAQVRFVAMDLITDPALVDARVAAGSASGTVRAYPRGPPSATLS